MFTSYRSVFSTLLFFSIFGCGEVIEKSSPVPTEPANQNTKTPFNSYQSSAGITGENTENGDFPSESPFTEDDLTESPADIVGGESSSEDEEGPEASEEDSEESFGGSNSCLGQCGNKNEEGCSCDAACHSWGDCCDDVCDLCDICEAEPLNEDLGNDENQEEGEDPLEGEDFEENENPGDDENDGGVGDENGNPEGDDESGNDGDFGQGDELEEEEAEPMACAPDNPGIGLPVGEAPAFNVAVSASTPFLSVLKNQGTQFYPDGNISILGGPGNVEVFLPVGTHTMRLTGPSVDNLSPSPGGPVMTPSGDINTPHQGYIGANTVMECNGNRHAFFHGENHAITGLPTPAGSAPPYHATMNRASAPSGTVSFQVDDDPCVVSSAGTPSYNLPKIAYGAGGGTVFDPGNGFLYLYYFDWEATQGIHVARSCREDCGAAGTWRKWDGSGFTNEAAPTHFLLSSGHSQALVPAGPGTFDAFSSVSFNTYLNGYLMVSATESGISMRVSANGIQWGPRVMVLEFTESQDATLGQFYPTLLDDTTLSRDQTGRNVRLIYGWQANEKGELAPHTAWSASIELIKEGDFQVTGSHLRPLVRYYNPTTGDHWVTTRSAPSGYSLEAILGQIPEASIPGTHPLYDCALGGNHIASRFTGCEGGTGDGIMGFLWTDSGPDRIPLYRCFVGLGNGEMDHFLSLDSGCEGATAEGVIGFIK